MHIATLLDFNIHSPFPLSLLNKKAPESGRKKNQVNIVDSAPSKFSPEPSAYARPHRDTVEFFWLNEAVYTVYQGKMVDIFPLGPIRPKLFEMSLVGPVLCFINNTAFLCTALPYQKLAVLTCF